MSAYDILHVYLFIHLYIVVIDDPNERVFRCLNQECLKETCRACGEP
ncbi:unnamed protein product, partial [Rotaria sordida]